MGRQREQIEALQQLVIQLQHELVEKNKEIRNLEDKLDAKGYEMRKLVWNAMIKAEEQN